jgi:urease accessory protein
MDHVLAMVAVGLWAAQLGGRARWALPATFVSLMAAGAALGMGGISVPGIEQGIMASVLVLGLLVATAARLPLAAGAAIVGGFALFHGFAHGSEMPANASGFAFGAGFVFSTLLLHAVGLAIGLFAQASARTPLLRVAGLAVVAGALFV